MDFSLFRFWNDFIHKFLQSYLVIIPEFISVSCELIDILLFGVELLVLLKEVLDAHVVTLLQYLFKVGIGCPCIA